MKGEGLDQAERRQTRNEQLAASFQVEKKEKLFFDKNADYIEDI